MSFFLAFVLLLSLGAIGYALQRRSAAWGQIFMAASALGSLAWIGWRGYQAFFDNSPRAPDRYHAVIAYKMGQYVAREVGGRRGTICLIFPPESPSYSEILDTWFDTFARVLSPFPSLEIKETSVKFDVKRLAEGELPLDVFQGALSDVPNALAYVSFVGAPLGVETLAQLGAGPSLFVFDPRGSTNWLSGLKSGALRIVILPRPGTNHAGIHQTAGPPDEIFEQFFLVATLATAEQVAGQLTGK